jgi:hypothetical protein
MANDEKTAKIPADPGGEKLAPADGPSAPGATGAVNPAALTVTQAAKVLSAVGNGPVTEDMLLRHIAAGAPTTADGRINLVHYAAWLNKDFWGNDGD